ncbi:hypothetical protein FTUN_6674 [Frigoriglobus tundricola]|uniref:Uncharacterized protein n=1 Tax=Frigoriglobus tundricola TaxID=2774151 RepID=A0A6M5Z041_9BACT|nr:hypothetical protein FTUN_6674 [Frigoriglobus tundricola]
MTSCVCAIRCALRLNVRVFQYARTPLNTKKQTTAARPSNRERSVPAGRDGERGPGSVIGNA